MGHIKVTIKGSPGAFCASVSDKKHHVDQKGNVTWNVQEPKDFPDDGVVYVQFTGDGPFIDGAKNHGHQSGTKGGPLGHFVSGTVTGTAIGAYTYALGYTDLSGDHPLVDPEIIVDGNRGNDDDNGDGRPSKATARRSNPAQSNRTRKSAKLETKKSSRTLAKPKAKKKSVKPKAKAKKAKSAKRAVKKSAPRSANKSAKRKAKKR